MNPIKLSSYKCGSSFLCSVYMYIYTCD